MKKILIISGHPDVESYNHALANAYLEGIIDRNGEYVFISLAEEVFDPNLKYGYKKRIQEEEIIKDAKEKILWSDHIVFIFPIWWGSVPAILKGFIDRVFTPGFAFENQENKPFPKRLLQGKSARVIYTMDAPVWYNWLVYGNAIEKIMGRATLKYCGIKPVKFTRIGNLRWKDAAFRQKWLRKVKELGRKEAMA